MFTRKVWFPLCGILLLLAGSAYALTPAGTDIKNQASASYVFLGETYTATSNEVITTVLPVYELDIYLNGQDSSTVAEPADVKYAYIGNTVYFQYLLTNHANIGDTVNFTLEIPATYDFTPENVTLTYDQNGNGVPDPGELAIAVDTDGDGTWDTINQDLDGDSDPDIGPIDGGSSINFVVSYDVPITASPNDSAYVGIVGTSHGDNTKYDPNDYSPQSEPGYNYNLTVVTDDAWITCNKGASPTVAAPGDTITYTISGSNTGGQTTWPDTIVVDGGDSTGVIIKDAIPDSSTYLLGSLTGNPGYGIYHKISTGLWTITEPVTATDVDSIAWITPNLDPSQTYTFTFKTTVNSGTTAGFVIHNFAMAYFRLQGGSHDQQGNPSNDAPVVITGPGVEYGVLIGPYHNSGAAPGGDSNADTCSVDTLIAGACALDSATVKNTGNGPDYINVAVNPATVPAGWNVTFFHFDGTTPLGDDNADGLVDVGLVSPADSASFKIRICVPSDWGDDGTDHDMVIQAISGGQSDTLNLTHIVADTVIGAALLFGNDDADTATVDETPDTLSTDPGLCVDFSLDLINTGGKADVYTLSVPTLPANWTTTFYNDLDTSRTLDPGEFTPITEIGPVQPGEEVHLIVRVCVSDGASASTYDIVFRATSTNDGSVFDNQPEAVIVNLFCCVHISPDRSGTAPPGGIVEYEHIVTNCGNTQNDTLNLTYDSPQSWTYMFIDDGGIVIADNDNDGNPDVILSAYEDTVYVCVRVFVPTSAPIGAIDNATITVTSKIGGCSDFVIDITEVIMGAFDLDKWVMDSPAAGDSSRTSEAAPGDTIRYRVWYKNLGADTVSSVIIYDPVPANTEFIDASGPTPHAGTIEYSTDGGAIWGGLPGDPTDVTNVRWIFTNPLAPAENGYIEMRVRIR